MDRMDWYRDAVGWAGAASLRRRTGIASGVSNRVSAGASSFTCLHFALNLVRGSTAMLHLDIHPLTILCLRPQVRSLAMSLYTPSCRTGVSESRRRHLQVSTPTRKTRPFPPHQDVRSTLSGVRLITLFGDNMSVPGMRVTNTHQDKLSVWRVCPAIWHLHGNAPNLRINPATP